MLKKTIQLILLYLALVLVVFFGLSLIFDLTLEKAGLLNWDAEHYDFIQKKGYEGFRVVFFPLFPLFWKLTQVDEIGISILNGILFLTSFLLLIKEYKIEKKEEIFLYLSIPCFIFFFLPYSEAMFFLCSTILLIGLKRNDYKLVYIGLFLAILCRPAFTVFIPALIFVEALKWDKLISIKRIGICISITILGLLIVAFIQFLDTGLWFKFFSEQKHWGNKLQMPKLPLTSWAGGFVVKLDGMAFLIGIISALILLFYIFKHKALNSINFSKDLLFSLAYLSGITFTVLLFRGGVLFSLNRFVLATPFIMIVLHYWLNFKVVLRLKNIALLFLLIFIFWFLFASYVHIQQILKYFLLTLYFSLLLLIKLENNKWKHLSFYTLIIINLIFQMILFIRFMSNEWVA